VPAAPSPPDRSSRPLVVSRDEFLLDDLLRVLAAAGTEPEIAVGGAPLRRAHRTAPLVLLGADVLVPRGSATELAAWAGGRLRRGRNVPECQLSPCPAVRLG
jgi:hypothetical protein